MCYSEGELYYDDNIRRWCINGFDLHCGDCFGVYRNGKWETVRIEYDHSVKEYYTIPHIPLQEYIKVRYKRY